MKIAITNAKLVHQPKSSVDILLCDGKIEAIENAGSLTHVSDSTILDAQGNWLTPGLIDVHVHLREPGEEWKETVGSGARAAVAGGFTSICCMPNTTPVNDGAEVTRYILAKAAEAKAARVFPIGAVSTLSNGKELAPLSEMREAGCVAFSDDGRPVWNAGLMRRALEWTQMLGTPIFGHEEEQSLTPGGVMNESALSLRMGLRGWPKVAEEIHISRDIELVRAFGGRVHFCHVTTKRGVELIRRAKNDGIAVSAEAMPHHLFLTEQAVENYSTAAKVNPPLREQEDVDALREGLADGTIDIIASDHAPHDLDTKRVEFDRASFGLVGLQSTLPLALELVSQGVLSFPRVIESLTSIPAKILGFSDLGVIKKGARADICIINPQMAWTYTSETILSKSKNTPFLNRTMKGKATTVIVDGKIVVSDGQVIV